MNSSVNKPELLIPAGSLDVLKVALDYGADAVYVGGEMFSLRAGARNFTHDDLVEASRLVHERGKKLYITANITAHEYDLKGVREYFEELKEVKPDALIVSDPGIMSIQREILPDIPIHVSTQANNVNSADFRFWHDAVGATRVVGGRELSLNEIKRIRSEIPDDLEIEAFVHGAMCISYSGRCLLSNYFTGRDANLGQCTHPCRWKYYVVEEKRPGEYIPVEENERGTYIFNSKDLCMIDHIPEIVDAGINSLKIEGRMKTALYVATVARTYRRAIDDFFESPSKYQENMDWYKDEITKCTFRQFTTGFYFNKPTHEGQVYDNNVYVRNYIYLGTVSEDSRDGLVTGMKQKNKYSVGDEIEVMHAVDYGNGFNEKLKVLELINEKGEAVQSVPHAEEIYSVRLSGDVKKGEILRVRDDS